jgi:hypothetical protein
VPCDLSRSLQPIWLQDKMCDALMLRLEHVSHAVAIQGKYACWITMERQKSARLLVRMRTCIDRRVYKGYAVVFRVRVDASRPDGVASTRYHA